MCLAEVLAMTGFAAYWSLLPVLQPEWHMSNALAGWLSGAFFGGYVLVVAFLTAMTDRVDARYVFILGAACCLPPVWSGWRSWRRGSGRRCPGA